MKSTHHYPSIALLLSTVLAASLPTAAQQVKPATGDAATELTAGDQASDYGPRVPQKPGNPATFPRLPDGHPDFTGIWYAGTKDLFATSDAHLPLPLKPEYQAVFNKRVAATEAGNPLPDFASTCQAFGMPRIMDYGNLEFVARSNELWVITEALHEVRRIFIDNRKHGEYQDPAFDGVSTGKWDGDTLVATTTDLRAGYLDMAGAPHSDQLKVIERFHFVNKDQLENDMTLIDPVAFTKPMQVTQRYDRRPADYDLEEYICTENYRSGGGLGLQGAQSPAAMLPPSANSDN